jgi:hypothetical protein
MNCQDCKELKETNPYARCERCADDDYYDDYDQDTEC